MSTTATTATMAELDPQRPAGVTPEAYARWQAYQAEQAQRLVCRSCGVDNARRECRDWCPVAAGACDCRHPHCGECMRSMGTSTSGIGYA